MSLSNLPKQFYYKSNRFQQLRGFYYTVQLGSLSKAAAFMSINQSAVSIQIKALEEDLKVTLLQRNGPKFTVTEAGRLFYTMITEHIEGINSICERFYAEYEKEKLTSLSIAANHISILHLLPPYIKCYKDLYPDIHIALQNINRQEAYQRLIENRLHVAITPVAEVPPELVFKPIKQYPTVLVVRKDHPLAHVKEIRVEDVSHYELIRIDPHLITVPMFEENIKQYGLKTRMTLENGDWEILKHLVRAGVGVAILSSICLDDNDTDLIGIDLSNYFPRATYGIVTKKGSIPLPQVQQFLQLFA